MYYLLGKDNCELCDKAEQLIVSSASVPKFLKINILDDKRLEQRYSWHIPVLIAIDSEALETIDPLDDIDHIGVFDNAETLQLAAALADRLERILPIDVGFNADPNTEIQPILDNEAQIIELFWPFPASRLRAFVSR